MIGLEDWMTIRQLREQGLTITDVARRLELNRRTVRRALQQQRPPEKPSPRNLTGLLNPYQEYVRGRLREHNLSAVRILEELREKGHRVGHRHYRQDLPGAAVFAATGTSRRTSDGRHASIPARLRLRSQRLADPSRSSWRS